ncbi:MAG: PIN domain-containing protein [Planctomycetes bacterium]|nr:PIN domain-containing protein [Planctomycetota bacterium]
MTDRVFVDTNVLVYAYDQHDPFKHQVASDLVSRLWVSRAGVASTQVLSEFFVVVTRKVRRPMAKDDAIRVLDDLIADWDVLPMTSATVIAAIRQGMPHGLSFWDALIWASARQAGVKTICSEDFAHGREVEGVVFQNPFLSSP